MRTCAGSIVSYPQQWLNTADFHFKYFLRRGKIKNKIVPVQIVKACGEYRLFHLYLNSELGNEEC
jgi:hypothetical protein